MRTRARVCAKESIQSRSSEVQRSYFPTTTANHEFSVRVCLCVCAHLHSTQLSLATSVGGINGDKKRLENSKARIPRDLGSGGLGPLGLGGGGGRGRGGGWGIAGGPREGQFGGGGGGAGVCPWLIHPPVTVDASAVWRGLSIATCRLPHRRPPPPGGGGRRGPDASTRQHCLGPRGPEGSPGVV